MINYTHRIYLDPATGRGLGAERRINNNLRAAADVKNNIPGDRMAERESGLMAMTIGKTNKGISARASSLGRVSNQLLGRKVKKRRRECLPHVS